MVARVTYRRRKSYATKSNAIKAVRTPGGKFIAQYQTKKAQAPKCADTGVQLYGIPSLRPFSYKHLAVRKRTVSRAYGGVLSAAAVKARIIRAFIAEEARILHALMKQRAKTEKAAAKANKAKKGSKGSKGAKGKKPAAKKPVAKKAAKKTTKA